MAFGGLPVKNAQVTLGRRRRCTPWNVAARGRRRRASKFVSISPLKSDAPDFVGAQWIPIRPNTDTALMLAMAHTLVSEEPP